MKNLKFDVVTLSTYIGRQRGAQAGRSLYDRHTSSNYKDKSYILNQLFDYFDFIVKINIFI